MYGSVFCRYNDRDLILNGMETSIQKSKITPKFFFISLGIVVSLITSVVSFLVLLFESLDKKFPDVLNSVYQYGYNSYNFETIRASLATLIIFFPIYLLISHLWLKECKGDIGQLNQTLRKWMIYFIIFLATLVIVIDLVTLVNYFISGEITTRFILKVVGALAVAFLVDFYYLFRIKNEDFNSEKSKKLGLVSLVISIFIFIGFVVWSFVVMGSPASQRAWRLDEKRVNDLQSIQYQVINYWQQKGKLPVSISNLSDPMSGFSIPMDPEFDKGKNYEYKILDSKDNMSFELCATFSKDMPNGWQENNYGGGVMPMYKETSDVAVSSYPYQGGVNESWDHKTGRTCFSRTIDKDMYPVFKK
jgi:hypothetical protein